MKVLIVTGGLVSGVEASILSSLRKLFQQWRASEHAWLDVKIKLVFGEFLIRKPRASSDDLWAPDLTEVLLATLLRQQGMPYMLATYGDLFDRPRLMEQLLGEADCVFASTTFLRDLSELTPLLAKAEEASQPDRRRRTPGEPAGRPLGRGRRRRHPGRRLWRTPGAVAGRLDALGLHRASAATRRSNRRARADADRVQRRSPDDRSRFPSDAGLDAVSGGSREAVPHDLLRKRPRVPVSLQLL